MVYLFMEKNIGNGKRLGRMAAAFIMILLLAAPWLAIRLSLAAINSDINPADMTCSVLTQNLKKVPVILNLFQQEVFGPKKWNIFWILFFAVLIWKRKMLLTKEYKPVTLFLLISVLGYFAGYMAITGGDLYFYINTTISRFMLHFTGICVFFAMYLVYDELAVRP